MALQGVPGESQSRDWTRRGGVGPALGRPGLVRGRSAPYADCHSRTVRDTSACEIAEAARGSICCATAGCSRAAVPSKAIVPARAEPSKVQLPLFEFATLSLDSGL